jgi:hypothetical protein
MIDIIGQNSDIFNRWINTFSVKLDQSFDYSISIRLSFQCFSNLYMFYYSFFQRSWAFFCRHGKKQQKLGEIFELYFDQLIDTIDSV